MAKLSSKLNLDRCPHCSVAKPNLSMVWNGGEFGDHADGNRRNWAAYKCENCGGVTLAYTNRGEESVRATYPAAQEVEGTIPSPAREYLFQAISSLHAPAGAVMLAASSVDAMMKAKEYTEGSLYTRINKAAQDHLITEEMAKWAHQVRLDANDQRHADLEASLPTEMDAKRAIDFAQALGMFLFVLPARVESGLNDSKGSQP